MKKYMAVIVLASTAAFAAPMVFADAPVKNVSAKRHPNLAAAQRMSHNAYEKVVAAQQANEFDMAGHAAKAKELLDQVNTELKAAAEAANKNGK